eukprot:675341-Ditylum_brightwellii.AAC.1
MAQVHRDVAIWAKYLERTGELLEYTKTKYTMDIWKFKPDGTPIIKQDHKLPPNVINIKEKSGKITTIKKVYALKPLKMLGVHKSFTLDKVTEMKAISTKTKRFTRALVSCPLKKHEVWKIYNTVYIPSVKYFLGTTAIEDKYLEDIQWLLSMIFLARLGCVSMFPQVVAFGPKYYRGIGILK